MTLSPAMLAATSCTPRVGGRRVRQLCALAGASVGASMYALDPVVTGRYEPAYELAAVLAAIGAWLAAWACSPVDDERVVPMAAP